MIAFATRAAAPINTAARMGALEPAISGQIMELHYTKHHQTYVNNFNAAEESLSTALSKGDAKGEVNALKAINFNGGGHINHSLFWENLAPTNQGGGELGSGPLREAIESQYGSLDELKAKFNAQLAGIQGSGWGWLGYCKVNRKLTLATTANQDPLLTAVPLIGIDAWEHAFYLQYLNDKATYFKNIWSVINFEEAQKRLIAATQ